MPLVFYNTLTKKKERFRPRRDREVRMYNCGPTVYDYAHIGNFRSYVFADTLRRYLEHRNYKVLQVMNLTDVDDKTIRGARREGLTLREYTDRYAKAFFEDIKALNILPAKSYPRATEMIQEMVEFIKVLIKKGHAYRGEDGIYFDISSFPSYGKLSGIEIKNLKAGARVRQDEYDKENAQDFALWKFWDENDGDVYWETEFGKGRPGWHIECSVMSMKELGTLDIHTGGVDLIFPHHENEIAQSEAFLGKPFVKYWMHNEHLLVEGRKMSKSLGNFFTLRDLLKKGHDPMAIRYLLLSAHYRAKLNFTENALRSAENTVNRLRRFVEDLSFYSSKRKNNPAIEKAIRKAFQGFERAMDDDLNVPEALPFLFDFVSEVTSLMNSGEMSSADARKAYEAMMDFNFILGLDLNRIAREAKRESVMLGGREFRIRYSGIEIDEEIKQKIIERERFRLSRQWKEADRIRESLRRKGIVLEDEDNGVKVSRD